ncbi:MULTISPECIES: septum formation family protein [unclassified Nocardiopsis]|uniref:septum formation family protein n=1 Tax=unclassified Nocardiopsis TaxID=2649073 RepID=UPI0033D0E41D
MPSLSRAVRGAAVTAAAASAVLSLSACDLLDSVLGSGNVMEIGVGDCFTESEMFTSDAGDEVGDVPLVDCSEPHDSEVFHVEELPDGDFPGAESVNASMEEVCTGPAFQEFVGVDFMESEIYASGLMPTVESWDLLEDREILCYVFSEEPISESLQGANR